MAFTNEFEKFVHLGNLYELTIEEAAQKLHYGLWNEEQATVEDIIEGLKTSIANGELKPIRGALLQIGNLSLNPPILDATNLASWAERHGLELESNGGWPEYLGGEYELYEALVERLQALRALQENGKSINDIHIVENDPDRLKDQNILLEAENIKLKEQLQAINNTDEHTSKKLTGAQENRSAITRAQRTLLTIIAALCSAVKLDYSARGASQRIKELTETNGTPVDDGTIAAILKKIPDALETRTK